MEPLSILEDDEAKASIASGVKQPQAQTCTSDEVVVYRTLVAQAWIEEDSRRGILPPLVGSFAELHDFVDANMYLIDEAHPDARLRFPFEWEWEFFDIHDHYQLVATALSRWLASDRTGNADKYLDLIPEPLASDPTRAQNGSLS